MQFTRTNIKDVVIVEPKVHGDDRGYFVESYIQDELNGFLGFNVNFIQDNESKSSIGVLRGLHYQQFPFTQSKLVRVVKGAVLDVAVDIRLGSPTFSQSVAVKLTAKNKKQLFVPRGFAHGFLVLEEDTIFSYKVDNYYSPKSDKGIINNEPEIAVDWGLSSDLIMMSEKDKSLPCLKDAALFDYSVNYYD